MVSIPSLSSGQFTLTSTASYYGSGWSSWCYYNVVSGGKAVRGKSELLFQEKGPRWYQLLSHSKGFGGTELLHSK